MNFSVTGQGASLAPPLLRNVGGGTAVDEDVFEIHLSTFFAITQDVNLHKRITVRASFPLATSTVLELQSLEFHECFVNSLAELKGRRGRLSSLTLLLGLHSSFICRKFTFYNSDHVCVFSIKLLPDSQSLMNCVLSGQGWGQMRG